MLHDTNDKLYHVAFKWSAINGNGGKLPVMSAIIVGSSFFMKFGQTIHFISMGGQFVKME